MSGKMSKSVIVGRNGPPCPRCDMPTEIREHAQITEKRLRQPFYYRRWYCCANKACKTTLVLLEEDKVFRDGPAANPLSEAVASPPRGHSSGTEPWQSLEMCKRQRGKPPWLEQSEGGASFHTLPDDPAPYPNVMGD